MSKEHIQLRGHCQCCGREQAVQGAYMSKHGYRVKDGWFQGVCSGHNYGPVEVSREQLDRNVAAIREECNELDERAKKLEACDIHPKFVDGPYDSKARSYSQIPWADATNRQRDDAVSKAVWGARQRARLGRQFADSLVDLANIHHGKPLREVITGAGPAPIQAGERRQGAKRVMTARHQIGAVVHWKDEKGFLGKTGSRSWRLLPLVQA